MPPALLDIRKSRSLLWPATVMTGSFWLLRLWLAAGLSLLMKGQSLAGRIKPEQLCFRLIGLQLS